jgi:hypothetical protein
MAKTAVKDEDVPLSQVGINEQRLERWGNWEGDGVLLQVGINEQRLERWGKWEGDNDYRNKIGVLLVLIFFLNPYEV